MKLKTIIGEVILAVLFLAIGLGVGHYFLLSSSRPKD